MSRPWGSSQHRGRDGWTDRRTDRQTDRRTDVRYIEIILNAYNKFIKNKYCKAGKMAQRVKNLMPNLPA